MQCISSRHWVAFVAMLREIEEATGIRINYENIEHVLVTEMGGQFPDGRMIGCAAAKDHDVLMRTSASGFPLLGASCAGPQPNRRGFDDPTLALKIVDMRGRSIAAAGSPPVSFAYDVFPNGRRVLDVGALRLDTRTGGSSYKSGSILSDTRDAVAAFPEYLAFITSIIDSFPFRSDPTIDRARQAALDDLFSA